MTSIPITLLDVARAIEQPAVEISTWLGFDGSDLARSWNEQLTKVLVSDDQISVDTFRAAFPVGQATESVTAIATRFDVNPSAISQRRTRMLAFVDDLRSGPLAESQLVAHVRRCVSGVVHTADLPRWIGKLIATRPDGPRSHGDLVLLVLNVALERPHRIAGDESGSWLVAKVGIGDLRSRNLKGLVNLFADEATAQGTRLLGVDELHHLASEWGVSPLSLSRFVSAMSFPALRLVTHGDRCVLLDNTDRRNVGRAIHAVVSLLDLPEQQVVDLLVTQHRRARGSVLNELSVRRNR